MLIEQIPVPAVVFGAGRHGGLAMTRSLGQCGVPVYVIDSKRGPAAFSRYCHGFFRWDVAAKPIEETLAFLLEVARKIGGTPVLIPTTDHTAILAVDNAEALSEAYLFPAQEAKTSRALVSKYSMFQLATRAGIPTPGTIAPTSRSELLEYLRTATFPLVLKLDDASGSGKHRQKTKSIVYDSEQLLREYDEILDSEMSAVVIQEYIPGGEDSIWMFNGYFDADSECLFGMTGQKIRQNPVYTGASCLAVCIQNSAVYQLTLKFMKSVGYRGILDIGFRYDARDGKYKVLDVNPRIGATFRLFLGTNGMDVIRALYLDLTGQGVPKSAPAPDGRKWIVEDCDLVSSWRYYRDGKLKPAEFVRSFRGLQEFSFLSLTDPVPMFSLFAFDLLELSSRTWKLIRPAFQSINPPIVEPND